MSFSLLFFPLLGVDFTITLYLGGKDTEQSAIKLCRTLPRAAKALRHSWHMTWASFLSPPISEWERLWEVMESCPLSGNAGWAPIQWYGLCQTLKKRGKEQGTAWALRHLLEQADMTHSHRITKLKWFYLQTERIPTGMWCVSSRTPSMCVMKLYIKGGKESRVWWWCMWNPSIPEAEEGTSVSSKPAWCTL